MGQAASWPTSPNLPSDRLRRRSVLRIRPQSAGRWRLLLARRYQCAIIYS